MQDNESSEKEDNDTQTKVHFRILSFESPIISFKNSLKLFREMQYSYLNTIL